MKQAKFTRCFDPNDLDLIKSWFTNWDYSDRCPAEGCIRAFSATDFTQQEEDDIVANSAANFRLVEFIL